jgi:hypothetical protein
VAADRASEWHYNAGAQKISVWKPGGGAPSNGQVFAARRTYGIDVRNMQYVKISGLMVRGPKVGVAASFTVGVRIESSTIEFASKNAIDVGNSTSPQISDSVIRHAVKGGIDARRTDGIVVQRNTMQRIGTVGSPRRGLGAIVLDNFDSTRFPEATLLPSTVANDSWNVAPLLADKAKTAA